MTLLDRYLGKVIVRYMAIVMLVLLGLFTFVNFLDQISHLGKGSYDLASVIAYVGLTIPQTAYELFPMAALLGTITGLSLLAHDSELIAMRASGVSLLQITSAALKVGGLFAVVAIVVGEFVAPYTENRAQRSKVVALQENINQYGEFGFWMRDAGSYINIEEVLPDLTLLKVNIFEFDAARKLRSQVSARNGEFKDDFWVLNDVRQTLFNLDGHAETIHSKASKWALKVTPQVLTVFLIKPEQMSFWQLGRYITHLKANHQKTDTYELAFWDKLMLPFSTAVMVILAIPFVFANIRSGTLGRHLFIGIMLGLCYHVVNKSLGYVVLALGLPPLLGATVPMLAFLVLALVMIQRIK